MSRFSSAFTLFDTLNERIAALPERDRRALLALGGFLLLCIIYAMAMFHQYAGKVEKNALSVQNELFWMRSQAPFIQSASDAPTASLRERIEQRARQQGMTVKVVEVGETAQFSLTHRNAAVLGSFVTGLAGDGIVFDRLAINQLGNLDVQAEATVRNAR